MEISRLNLLEHDLIGLILVGLMNEIWSHRAELQRFVLQPHLGARLNEGLDERLTLISAPAGFGKTTLVSEWVAGCQRPAAWL